MNKVLTGAVLFGLALAVPAMAAPGECSFTGYESFDCDVAADGGGVTFTLPDGDLFVFAQTEDGEGLGYRIAADVKPGQRPEELGAFSPVEGEPGCWLGSKDELKFCAAIAQ
ncbi:MAG: hypothetical protein KIT02_06220 [Devosia sp.]|uniref:hypothetical protein n=1 Tax=Devosia sp. TaxID=1871048 RepID=UPI0024C845A3|nr:hypothetical protein [Devosia sp.]UYO00799.1 MAG: hypothetical protein KIT02_06220 [Devosia sp.]